MRRCRRSVRALERLRSAGSPPESSRPAAARPHGRRRTRPSKITVKASEFKFVLSRRSVPAGTTVVFTVINKGKITHDFKIAGKKTPKLAPGKKATLTVVVQEEGQVRVPLHAARATPARA